MPETTVSMVVSWVQVAAAKHPERVAIEGGERMITYAELARSGRAGARADQPVALEIEDRFEFALALHACLASRTPVVPIDLRLSNEERELLGVVARRAPEAPGVATVLHTSGTTSAPKRVELTYDNWLASALSSAVALGLDPDERWLCAMPLSHVGGLSILIRSLIYATTAVIHQGFDTEAVRDELMDAGRRITLVSLVPTMLSRLLDAGLRQPPTLRWALVGGGPTPPTLLERAAEAGIPVAPTYGMTESCSQLFTFGLPLHGVDWLTSEGELWVRGPMLAPGCLSGDGWLHTGDLARFDERGRLEIVGRKANTIISGGENVAPEEVEAVLLSHPAVADAAVVGRPDAEWGEAVVALVVSDRPPEIDGLRAFCRQRLAAFKVPKAFERVDRLPRTTSGKLLRRELR